MKYHFSGVFTFAFLILTLIGLNSCQQDHIEANDELTYKGILTFLNVEQTDGNTMSNCDHRVFLMGEEGKNGS